MKKPLVAVLCTALGAVLIGGSILGYSIWSRSRVQIPVESVSVLQGYWGDNNSTYGVVTTDMTQEVFLKSDMVVDEVLVLESTYNAAAQGADADMQYVCDPKGMLLCYTTGAPAIDEPSAGYIFAWDMLGAGQHMAVTNFQGAPGTHSEFVEALCAFDMQQVSTDLAVYCKNCVA